MHLKRLELSGFKSFSQATTLDFTTPITAIVGPNGSGKSNIAEAVRFALGEQSMRSLRGKKGEDLIFNGTNTVPRLNRASVAVVFDNQQDVFPVDYDEVEIKRVVHRDGINQYAINKSSVRLKDIIELLASVHIGATSHHIISQGEADRILNATIKERRVMVEDALGLKIYQYKRAESERKLAKTRENISHTEALRNEITPHLKFLEKQVEKIQKVEKMQEELEELYVVYLKKESFSIFQQKKNLKRERETPEKEKINLEKRIIEQEKILSATEQNRKKDQELTDLEIELREIREKKDAVSRKLGRLEGMLEYKEREHITANQGDKQGGRIIISSDSANQFIDEVSEYINKGEEHIQQGGDPKTISNILEGIKKIILVFSEKYIKKTNILPKHTENKDEYEEISNQKKHVEEEIVIISKREDALYSRYRTKKEELEKEMNTERHTERQLFELRNRKTELVTRLELFAVKEEKITEEEEILKREHDEAVHFFGKKFIDLSGTEKQLEDSGGINMAEQAERRRKIEHLKFKIEDVGGGGVDIVKEYDEVLERDQFLKREIADLEKSATTLDELTKELGEKINSEFKEGVKKINKEFQSLFSLMFDGGVASIKVISPPLKRKQENAGIDGCETNLSNIIADDEIVSTTTTSSTTDNESEEGIDITVRLPQKRIKGLAMLSGGERALTSLALIFAITKVKPPPFLFLDETDAAFDEANSRKYGTLLLSLSTQTQLIIITHNRETMSHAGVLYGVTTTSEGTSRLLSIKLDKAMNIAE